MNLTCSCKQLTGNFMPGLDLTPNPFVGYRIKPDWYSFNVVIVKRHGAASKLAGQEYEKPVAYCKSIASAVQWIVRHAARVRGELAQADQVALDGSVASAVALESVFQGALEDALSAALQLQGRVDELGLPHKELVKALGTPEYEIGLGSDKEHAGDN